MVLADGSFVAVNSEKNSGFFWAIRGGGGNFGIVITFTFQAHSVTNVFGEPTLWPIEKTNEIMKWYYEFLNKAPDDLNGFFTTIVIPARLFP